MGQSVSGDSQILNQADVNPNIVAKPVSAVLHPEARHMAMFANSALPQTQFTQIGDREGVCKAKLQTVPAILPKLVFLMHRIKNNEIVLDYCDGRV